MDEHSFESQATVFILEKREWKERGSGLVRFVFDLKTYALILINNPGTRNEFSCRLKPRIRSKGPRAYVIRAEADENNRDKMILAVRFEREKDSQAFRRFVERREPQPQDSQAFGMGYHPNPNAYPQQHKTTVQIGGVPPNHQYMRHPTMDERSFFWTCPSCVQMNDAMVNTCIVCGTYKPMGKGPDMAMMQRPMAQGMPMQNQGFPGQFERFGSKQSLTQPALVDLTVENLARLNNAMPPQKRNPKEIIIDQLQYYLSIQQQTHMYQPYQ